MVTMAAACLPPMVLQIYKKRSTMAPLALQTIAFGVFFGDVWGRRVGRACTGRPPRVCLRMAFGLRMVRVPVVFGRG